MTFDHELILISSIPNENKIGDHISLPINNSILCSIQSITRAEHYQAASQGLRPEIVFVVNKHDYNGEKKAEFNGKAYKVLRTYAPKFSKGIGDFETLELICVGVGHHGYA